MKNCQWCRKPFNPVRKNQQFCNRICKNNEYNFRLPVRRIASSKATRRVTLFKDGTSTRKLSDLTLATLMALLATESPRFVIKLSESVKA
jgi:hypothetical protein